MVRERSGHLSIWFYMATSTHSSQTLKPHSVSDVLTISSCQTLRVFVVHSHFCTKRNTIIINIIAIVASRVMSTRQYNYRLIKSCNNKQHTAHTSDALLRLSFALRRNITIERIAVDFHTETMTQHLTVKLLWATRFIHKKLRRAFFLSLFSFSSSSFNQI